MDRTGLGEVVELVGRRGDSRPRQPHLAALAPPDCASRYTPQQTDFLGLKVFDQTTEQSK